MFIKKNDHQIKYIIYKNISITVKIKKYQYSRNYKVSYDKKNLQALVTIPKYISFKSGFKFAEENIDWIYQQHIEMMPSIILKHGNLLTIDGKEKSLFFKKDKINNVHIDNEQIIVSSKSNNKHSLVLHNWIRSKNSRNSQENFIRKIS